MKRHRDVTVSSFSLDAANLARYIERFAQSAAYWEFHAEQSHAYEVTCGEPSCCVVATALPESARAAVFLTKSGPRSLRTTNIVPLESYKLDVDQYNTLAVRFTKSLRKQVAADQQEIRVSVSKGTLSLNEVVTGKCPTLFFRQYIGAYPLSWHPSDVDRLDKFICALARYSRKNFDLDAFEHLLIEELEWSSSDAARCRSRVEVGLEVLAAYKKF